MKKIVSMLMFVISVAMVVLSEYSFNWQINYHTVNFFGFMAVWSLSFFILSLFALVLERSKYQRWFYCTLICAAVSIFLAYMIGDGTGGILNVDGELVTWFLAGLYSFISIIYFIAQYIKSKKQPQTTQVR